MDIQRGLSGFGISLAVHQKLIDTVRTDVDKEGWITESLFLLTVSRGRLGNRNRG
jgi:hypothetical protein